MNGESQMKTLKLILALALACAIVFAQPTNSAQKKVTLMHDQARYCVGEKPQYAVTGTSDLSNLTLNWSYSFKPLGAQVGVNGIEGSYGQRLANRGAFSFWSGEGSVWSTSLAGSWTKTVSVGGNSDTVSFSVEFCDAGQVQPYGMYLAPNYGATFFNNMETSAGTADIYAVLENLSDPSMVQSWRVVLNNRNVTSQLAASPARFTRLYEIVTPTGGFAGGVTIHIPIPFIMMESGNNDVEVEVDMANGSKLFAYNTYPLRPVDDVIRDFVFTLPQVPVGPVSCQLNSQTAVVGGNTSFVANGGDGTFTWAAPGGNPSVGTGRYFNTVFSKAGPQNVFVASAGKSAPCGVLVSTPPPSIPPKQ